MSSSHAWTRFWHWLKYGDLDPDLVEMVPGYREWSRKEPRLSWGHFMGGTPGGGWFVRLDRLSHRAYGVTVYGALARFGWSLTFWPPIEWRLRTYSFPSRGEKIPRSSI